MEDLAEVQWCCYAFPSSHGKSGTRTFFVNPAGVITTPDHSAYSGSGAFNGPVAGRAFMGPASDVKSMTGFQAVGTVGRDGRFWRGIE